VRAISLLSRRRARGGPRRRHLRAGLAEPSRRPQPHPIARHQPHALPAQHVTLPDQRPRPPWLGRARQDGKGARHVAHDRGREHPHSFAGRRRIGVGGELGRGRRVARREVACGEQVSHRRVQRAPRQDALGRCVVEKRRLRRLALRGDSHDRRRPRRQRISDQQRDAPGLERRGDPDEGEEHGGHRSSDDQRGEHGSPRLPRTVPRPKTADFRGLLGTLRQGGRGAIAASASLSGGPPPELSCNIGVTRKHVSSPAHSGAAAQESTRTIRSILPRRYLGRGSRISAECLGGTVVVM
jgi:hypothetical protein